MLQEARFFWDRYETKTVDVLTFREKLFTFTERQGHGVKGLDNTVRLYRAWFDFLSKVTD
ncbi:MAG: hypothetical protein ACE5IR_13435 [bacterium]